MKESICVFGLGNMGLPIYHRIPSEFYKLAYDPYIVQNEVQLETDMKKAVESSDILILCVKPDKIIPLLLDIHLPKKIISIAAGITLHALQENLPKGSKVLRIMPNLPLISGEGVIGACGDKDLMQTAKLIFSASGSFIELEKEDEINCITALSGSGPAFAFTFLQALTEGGLKCGLSYPTSLKIAIQTIKGSMIFLENELKTKPETHPYLWRNKVTSPGGTTIYGLHALENGNFNYLVVDAVYKAFLRARELGENKK